MAGRIRSIKPELLDDEIVSSLSDAAWRLFVSSWLLADDYGCFRAGPRYLAAQVWQDTSKDALTPLLELADAGRVLLYEAEGQPYALIPTWERHQRVDNAGKRRVPAPPTNIRKVSRRFAEFLRESPRVSATLGISPLGPKTSPLDHDLRSPITDHEIRARGGYKTAPPSGSGLSSCRTLEHTPLAPDETLAHPTGDLAGSEVGNEEGPFLEGPVAPEPPRAPSDVPTPVPGASGAANCQPEPLTAPRPDEPAPPPETAPETSGPVDEPGAPSDPGQAVLPLALVPSAALKKKSDPVEEIFTEYVTAWKKTSRGRRPPKLDDKRRRLTLARLRDFTEDDLKAAARGVFASEWHVQEGQTSYELVMRDAAHVERFRGADEASRPATQPWKPDPGRPSPRVMDALRRQRESSPGVDLNAMLEDIGTMRLP